jgi:hypothetical protein
MMAPTLLTAVFDFEQRCPSRQFIKKKIPFTRLKPVQHGRITVRPHFLADRDKNDAV